MGEEGMDVDSEWSLQTHSYKDRDNFFVEMHFHWLLAHTIYIHFHSSSIARRKEEWMKKYPSLLLTAARSDTRFANGSLSP